jgi:hypothetical protein
VPDLQPPCFPPPPANTPPACMQTYARAAAAVCGKQPAQVMKLYPAIQADQAPYLCMDLTMIHALLTRGFGIGEKTPLLVVIEVGPVVHLGGPGGGGGGGGQA